MPDVNTKRLFIAIELPPGIKDSLGSIQKELKQTGADAKWVEPENIHLTLKFLGSVETEKIKDIARILDKISLENRRLSVSLDQLGVFPSLNSARVVWAGVTGKIEDLKNIAQNLDKELSGLKFEKETREFQAHATIARIRSSRNRAALAQKIKDANQNFSRQDFSIDNITLFESTLSPHGPTYSIIHQVKLK